MSTQYNPPKSQTVTISSGGTTTPAVRVTAGVIMGIILPAAFTGTAITIQGCDTVDGTFGDVYDSDGNQVSLAASASRAIGLSSSEADACAPWPYIKLVSNAAEGADRDIRVVLR